MAAANACLKWVDMLEHQFDKSWVDLDLLFNQIEEDEEEMTITPQCRRHASSLASCFSQLAHKSTLVFQSNAKLEAELLHLREEISLCREALVKIKQEKEYLTLTLQSTLVENHGLKFNTESEEQEINNPDSIKDRYERPAKPASREPSIGPTEYKDSFICERLKVENLHLRKEIFDLESELVGARLDNVYLDKELAGRIQQIQLLASTTQGDVKERLWTQIEAEMCLQRAKTIAQICQTKQELKLKRARAGEEKVGDGTIRGTGAKKPPPGGDKSREGELLEEGAEKISNGIFSEEKWNSRGKQVMVLKNPADDLGMAIIGGSEHNLPIIISEVFPDSAVSRSNKLKAGDIILSVNGESFTGLSHKEAVTFLAAIRGQITFELQAAEAVSEDDPSNLDFRFYRIFDYVDNAAHQMADRSQTKELNQSLPGRAVNSVDLGRADSIFSATASGGGVELPPVHSPRRDYEKLELRRTTAEDRERREKVTEVLVCP